MIWHVLFNLQINWEKKWNKFSETFPIEFFFPILYTKMWQWICDICGKFAFFEEKTARNSIPYSRLNRKYHISCFATDQFMNFRQWIWFNVEIFVLKKEHSSYHKHELMIFCHGFCWEFCFRFISCVPYFFCVCFIICHKMT